MEKRETFRVWIADDHQLILDGYRLLLSFREDLEIAGESNDGVHLLESLKNHPVQLIISDLRMPGMDGFELMSTIKKSYPDTPVLVISMSDEMELIHKLFTADVEGFILKNSGKKELFDAIDDLLAGGIHYEKSIMNRLLSMHKELHQKQIQVQNVKLSPRELEVFTLILKEHTSKEITKKLFISKQTVDTHRLNIYEKTGAETLVGLIKIGLEMGLV
ncbi:MAG TPA: response regulator transcription factor [Catalimonadaceae bacterium]|nr:response regulator transcription factor [Catalimonadaceae bacterium]